MQTAIEFFLEVGVFSITGSKASKQLLQVSESLLGQYRTRAEKLSCSSFFQLVSIVGACT
jgi:hypothetical protein